MKLDCIRARPVGKEGGLGPSALVCGQELLPPRPALHRTHQQSIVHPPSHIHFHVRIESKLGDLGRIHGRNANLFSIPLEVLIKERAVPTGLSDTTGKFSTAVI